MNKFWILLSLIYFGLPDSLTEELGFHQLRNSHHYTLVFEHGKVAPDNYVQDGILTNGKFPGPTLKLRQGDLLAVEVVNKLEHGLVIHFHGIHQSGSVSSDGVPGVTQYEIPPNGTYRYSMDVGKQSGTFIYHAHTGLDQNWAMGIIIVEDWPSITASNVSAYRHDHERAFLLSQCWHTGMSRIAAGILGSPFEDIPDTDSLLINGRSFGNWELGSSGNETGYEVITVIPGATYRFRVVSLALDSMLTFRIANHSKFQVIEMDSILTEPVETDHLEINTAQRYSILVTMDQPIGNYWIETEMIPGPGPTNGRAILHYEGGPNPDSMRTQIFTEETEEVELNPWILSQLHPSQSLYQPILYPVPKTVDKEIIISSKQVNVNGTTKFALNGEIFRDYDPPILHQIRYGVNVSSDEHPHVFEILVGESIQIVFQNTMSDDRECEQHPWHLHGHAFHVVGHGPDKYNATEAESIIQENVANGLNEFRDVVTLFSKQTEENFQSGAPCGWVAVRFIANNPGTWIVHCHLTAHMLMGKLFILYEHSEMDPRLAQIQ